ncbi:MAG TPA: alpha/beta fold hydrolase [Gemmatimonadaceae bacterium]|nr:alpha/beta fold hydrolase [Gemmatimonadaceae bacterium]
MIPYVLLAILIVAAATRLASRRRVERAVAARLPLGADGLIPGAGPIELSAPGARDAVLLIHGFGDSPDTLRFLAADLYARGFSVYAPLLPGHGRTLEAFRASARGTWLNAARDAYAKMAARYDRVGVVGLSMGGALAVLVALDQPQVAALVLLAPYIEPPRSLRWFAQVAPAAGVVMPYFGRGVSNPRSIRDPEERARSLGYGASTPRLLADLEALAAETRAVLGRVRAPTLYIQSREDNRLTMKAAEETFAAIGAPVKRLEWVNGSGHVITVDYARDRVTELVGSWMMEYLRAGSGASLES